MSKIKIISGWSNPGGSTLAHIGLTKLLNEYGVECTFYGPHDWHLTKSRYCARISDIKISPDDIVISHFLEMKKRPPVKKLILSLHEKHLFPLNEKDYKVYDKIHYLNERQRSWHNVNHPYFICPNVPEILLPNPKKVNGRIAGIIGTIDRNKNTHYSIERALTDGMEKIIIYGMITDESYFQEYVKPLIEKNMDKVFLGGYLENKQTIYDSVTDVYMSSSSENASFVADECFMTKTIFHGNQQVPEVFSLPSKEEVFEIWKKELDIS